MNVAAVLFALLDGAWQGAVLFAIAYAALRFAPPKNAATMLSVWNLVLAICIALPIIDCVAAIVPPKIAAGVPATMRVAAVSEARPPQSRSVAQAATHGEDNAKASSRGFIEIVLADVAAYALPVLVLLGAIATIRVAVVVRSVIATLRLRAVLTPIEPPVCVPAQLGRPYRFVTSPSLRSPCVLGFSPALIVIPEHLLDSPPQQLLGIVLHECAHVRRYDDVRNVIERLIAAVAFGFPGILLALRRIALFREQLCDDAAVEGTGDAIAYAATLAQLAQRAMGPNRPVPCLIFERNHLPQRLRVLLDAAAVHSPQPNRRFVLAAGLAATLIAAPGLEMRLPAAAATPPQAAMSGDASPIDRDVDTNIHDRGDDVWPTGTFTGTWDISKCSHDRIRLELAYNYESARESHSWNISSCDNGAQTPDIDSASLVSLSGSRTFAIVRDAGKGIAIGNFRSGFGSGKWTFVPSDEFAETLKALGVPHVSASQQFRLWIADFELSTLREMREAGFPPPSPGELERLGEVGVDRAFVAEALRLPMRAKSVETIFELRERGLRADDMIALQQLGLALTAEDVVRLADHGIRAPWIAHLRQGGYTGTSVDELIRLHDGG